MPKINSTSGQLDSHKLGRTLIHEHVLVGFPGWWLDNRQPKFRRTEAMAKVVDNFQRLKAYGVQTVVDPCPMDLGRDVEFCAEVSQKTGINLICATGVYYEAAGIPFSLRHLEPDALAEIYIKEIEHGVGETGIKPGIIKIATGDGKVSGYERLALTAAAKAAKATGVPVLSHTENCTCGHDQIDIIVKDGGLAAGQLLVGHSDGTKDIAYQRSLAERGVYVGFDRFGLTQMMSDEVRMTNLKTLADEGFLQQLMISQDYVACWLGAIPGLPKHLSMADIAPNWRLTHIFENILPALKAQGMTEEDFTTILTDNPQRFFGG